MFIYLYSEIQVSCFINCGKCNTAHFAYKEVLENPEVVMCMWCNVMCAS